MDKAHSYTSGRKILIVEDDSSESEIMDIKFNQEGFEVIRAKDGEEGFHIATKEQPNLIMLDLKLPKMDGITVMRKLKEDEWGKNIPIIILTNVPPEDRIVEKVAEDEPAYFLPKAEMSLDDVVAKAKEVLNIV